MPGKLTVIEGSDASGKKTQTNLLCSSLKQFNYRPASFTYPIYDSATGRIISSYLHGEFGPTSSIHPKMASLLYAMNRLEFKLVIEEALRKATVVCDRYVESNMGHQGGKIIDPAKREEFFEWCANLEYEEFKLPRPTLGIFLHVPWAVSFKIAEERGDPDGHESDPHHLEMAEKSYLHMAAKYGWYIVECCPESCLYPPVSLMRSIEDIAAEIFGVVKAHLDG